MKLPIMASSTTTTSTLLAHIAVALTWTAAAAQWEWAGTFTASSAHPHKWNMQKVGGSYADPSMKIVLYTVDDPNSQESIEKHKEDANTLIAGTTCTKVMSGGEINPATNPCWEMVVDEASDDSSYTILSEGVTGVVVFAQHVPIEFERDTHYLQDANGADVEPILQEGGEGGHAHGHHDHGNEEHDDHGDEEKQACACAAAEHNFNIDCSATTAMSDAVSLLKASGCATDCSSEACIKAWLIVQTHHDYCPTDGLPTEVEHDFHDFDSTCKGCAIARQYIDGVPDCPIANCKDNSGNEAYAFLVDNGCASDCTTQPCTDNYATLRVVHDDCEHDVLSTAAEEGLHDFEEGVCPFQCNAPASKNDQLTCTAPVTADGTASAAATGSTVMATGAVLGAALFLA